MENRNEIIEDSIIIEEESPYDESVTDVPLGANTDKPIMYLHIPKCAGSSMSRVLSTESKNNRLNLQFPMTVVQSADAWNEYVDNMQVRDIWASPKPSWQINRNALGNTPVNESIKGNGYYHLHMRNRRFISSIITDLTTNTSYNRMNWFCMLRDPIKRSISEYYWLLGVRLGHFQMSPEIEESGDSCSSAEFYTHYLVSQSLWLSRKLAHLNLPADIEVAAQLFYPYDWLRRNNPEGITEFIQQSYEKNLTRRGLEDSIYKLSEYIPQHLIEEIDFSAPLPFEAHDQFSKIQIDDANGEPGWVNEIYTAYYSNYGPDVRGEKILQWGNINRMDLSDFVIHPFTGNVMVKFLLGRNYLGSYEVTDNDYDRLIETIERLDIKFGIQEQMEDTIDYWNDLYNDDINKVSVMNTHEKKNTGTKKELNEYEYNMAVKNNKYDIKLYKYALDKLNNR
tara:strand:+ start:4225 stop:5580 length:1356 start_codon:yes stop_codon:yes gene_type:complete